MSEQQPKLRCGIGGTQGRKRSKESIKESIKDSIKESIRRDGGCNDRCFFWAGSQKLETGLINEQWTEYVARADETHRRRRGMRHRSFFFLSASSSASSSSTSLAKRPRYLFLRLDDDRKEIRTKTSFTRCGLSAEERNEINNHQK